MKNRDVHKTDPENNLVILFFHLYDRFKKSVISAAQF